MEMAMKFWIAAIAVMLMVGFTSVAHAAKPAKAPKADKPVMGQVKSVAEDGKSIVIMTMGKTPTEMTITVDEKTVYTLDGKDAKITDLKADLYVTVKPGTGTATTVDALTEKPKGKGKKPV